MANIHRLTFPTIFFLTVSTAFFLRFWHLQSLPCGLFPDSAINGLEVIKDKILPYYTAYGEHDGGLFIWALIAFSRVFSLGEWQIYALGAIFGSLTVPILMLALRRLYSNNISITTGILLATSTWHIALSRNGLRAVTLPFVISLIFLVFSLYKTSKPVLNWLWLTLLALFTGLGFYTYPPFWVLIPVLPLFLVFLAKWRGTTHSLVFLAIFTFIISPLALFFIQHPSEIFARSSQVSTLAQFSLPQTVIQISQDTLKTLAGFFVGMDQSFRHNLNNLPLLPPVLNIILPFSLLCLAFQPRKKFLSLTNSAYLAAFALFLLPAILTHEGSTPHGMRLIGEIPLVFIITALVLNGIFSKIPSRLTSQSQLSVYILLLLSLTWHSFSQLKIALVSPRLASDYRCDLKEVTNYLTSKTSQSIPGNTLQNTYVVATTFDRFSLDFYLYQDPYWGFSDLSPTKIKHLDPDNFASILLVPGDIIIAPVYGILGFYHLDSDPVVPYGGQGFLRHLQEKYPTLRLTYKHSSSTPSRYPQGLSFLIYTL